MLYTKDLSFQYAADRKFSYPNLQCAAGEILLVTGQSGCGKTTLLHLLAGILKAQSGEVVVNEQPLHALSQATLDRFRGEHIGIVYQKAHFVAALSVADNLALPLWLGSKGHDRARIQTLAERLGIGHTLDRKPHQLSIGEQQRASIARAVVHHPKLILADEPTSALDDNNCAEVLSLLKEMAAAENAALVVVSHDGRLKEEIGKVVML